ncbi:hypothetical protein [Rossellomorea aquimaris]|uniref:Uncharacterized protein n=1 Tax=Rossellomorea aquimaris TaxID=189382 RepID=A0A5D4UNQ1_9BACI|nr:hypothetical protein [Rossellomorea aquimaris]TYS81897.1 hypothetical protein FZD05_03605 [Rossellomorea aquimaris]TYS88521.1 hypothetical protein FZC85_03605 [Rossellomorea aquimaris]
MITIQTYISKKDCKEMTLKGAIYHDFSPLGEPLSREYGNNQLIKSDGISIFGAVTISIYQKPLSTFNDWDDVDELWLSLLESLKHCLKYGHGISGFSMRTLDWEMKLMKEDNNDSILFTWNHWDAGWNTVYEMITVCLPKKKLVDNLLAEGEFYVEFRNSLSDSGPSSKMKRLIDEIISFN